MLNEAKPACGQAWLSLDRLMLARMQAQIMGPRAKECQENQKYHRRHNSQGHNGTVFLSNASRYRDLALAGIVKILIDRVLVNDRLCKGLNMDSHW